MDDNVVTIAACLTASISGHKFNDLNGDGIQEAGEPGLAGLTVYLDANNNGTLDAGEVSTITDVNGNYSFDNLSAGTYHVLQLQQAGVLQTTANPAAVTLAEDQTATGITFGDFLLVSISGTKFQDTNANGVPQRRRARTSRRDDFLGYQ